MNKYQHQPLRTPQGWNAQENAFVIQLEKLLDDIYIQIGLIKEAIKDLEDRVSELEE